MIMPITGLGMLSGFVIMAIFAWRLRGATAATNRFFYFFKKMAFFFSIFYFFMMMPLLFTPQNGNLMEWGYIIGHFFLYIAEAYLIRVTLSLMFPKASGKISFGIGLFLAVVITVINIVYFMPIKPLGNGVVPLTQAPQASIPLILEGVAVLLPLCVAFIIRAIKDVENRRRYLLIGIGFSVMFFGGPAHDVVSTPIPALIADIVQDTGFLLILAGVLLKSKKGAQKA